MALYLEQLLEDHLQIVDRRVTGEFGIAQLRDLQEPQEGGSAPPGPPPAQPSS
ncbi:MAG: hypothetical protein V3R90_05710 [Limibaculum sp.]